MVSHSGYNAQSRYALLHIVVAIHLENLVTIQSMSFNAHYTPILRIQVSRIPLLGHSFFIGSMYESFVVLIPLAYNYLVIASE